MGLATWFTRRAPALSYIDLAVSNVPAFNKMPTNLGGILINDLFGEEAGLPLMTRAEALMIPAVSKVRNLLVSTIAPLPLVAIRSDGTPADQPNWLYRTDSIDTPYDRMAMTVDDILFYGCSLWLVDRGSEGQILRAAWCPFDRWHVSAEGAVFVDDEPLNVNEFILINAPYDGLLAIGTPTLRGAWNIERAWEQRARNPIPLTTLRNTTDDELEQEEVDALLTGFRRARKDPEGATAYVPSGIELQAFGESTTDLFVEGRNAAITSIGQLTNVRAAMLDGTLQEASLTYVTKEGERSLFLALDVPFYTNPIEHRLSLDDAVPRGTRVRFDMSELLTATPTPTGNPEVKD